MLRRTRLIPRSLPVAIAWLLVAGLVGVAFIAPLVLVIVRSLGDPFYQSYVTVAQSEAIRTIMFRTVRLGLIVTASCAALGYPAAYALTRVRPQWRLLALGAIMLPFLSSYLVRTYGWIAILGNSGPLSALGGALGWSSTSLTGTLPGLVVAMTHMLLPLMIMPIYASMSAIDTRQMLACASLGAGPAESFVRVYFPQTLPGLLSGILLVFILSLGFFITPALIGGASETTISQVIYMFINELFDWKRSSSLAVGLLVVVVVLFAIAARFVDLGMMFGVKRSAREMARGIRGREPRTALVTSGLARLASHLPLQHHGVRIAQGFLALALLILLLPLVYVLLVSFQPLRLLALPTNGFSLNWYAAVLNKTEWYEAALNSLAIAALTTMFAFAAGLFLATRARREHSVLRTAITALALGPIALPVIVLALGIYAVFIQLGWTGSIVALAVAHTIVAVPYVFTNMANGLASYDGNLDQAASSLGARPWASFWRIKVPVLRTSIVTACVLAFLISFDELVITLFLAGPALPTLPVRMWAATSQNISPELAVVGTLLTLLVLLAFAFIMLIGRRRASPISAAQPTVETA